VMAEHSLSERHACKLLEMDRTCYRYEPQPDRNAVLREKRAATTVHLLAKGHAR